MNKRLVYYIIMAILVAIMFSSCVGGVSYKNQGYLHPDMSKLHNIQVIEADVYNTKYERIYYYSYKDSTYYTCIIPTIYKEDFKEGNIIK